MSANQLANIFWARKGAKESRGYAGATNAATGTANFLQQARQAELQRRFGRETREDEQEFERETRERAFMYQLMGNNNPWASALRDMNQDILGSGQRVDARSLTQSQLATEEQERRIRQMIADRQDAMAGQVNYVGAESPPSILRTETDADRIYQEDLRGGPDAGDETAQPKAKAPTPFPAAIVPAGSGVSTAVGAGTIRGGGTSYTSSAPLSQALQALIQISAPPKATAKTKKKRPKKTPESMYGTYE